MKMDMSLKDVAEGIRKILNNATLWFILATCATALMFSPQAVATRLGIDSLRSDYAPWIGVAWLVSTAVLVTFVVSRLWARVQRHVNARACRRATSAALATLSPDEWSILLLALGQNQKTVYLQFSNSPAAALVSKGLLVQAGGRAHILHWPFTVPDAVWDVLQERRDVWEPILDEWGPQGVISRAARFDMP